jgi:membrane-associated HD superfamily phosphohydrolase
MKTNSLLIVTVTLFIIAFTHSGLPETNYTDVSSRVKAKPPAKKTFPGSFRRENEIKLRKLARQYHATDDLSERAKIKQEMKDILEEDFDKATEIRDKQLENLDVRRRARRKREKHRDRNRKDAVDARLKQLLNPPPKR